MSTQSHLDCQSMYLTEDEEDSRDTIVESEINPPRYKFERIEQSFGILSQSPLIPIPRVNSQVKSNKNFPNLSNIKLKTEPSELLIPNQFLVDNTILTETPKNTTYTRLSTASKLVFIKKNNKLYKIVIPHNVMPTICETGGPVIINIPEVGPLVIKIDPEVKKDFPTKNSSTLESFSLDFDGIIETTSTVKMVNENSVCKESYTSLKNKTSASKEDFHCCGNYIERNKRKPSITYGFSKSDCESSRRCLNKLSMCVYERFQGENKFSGKPNTCTYDRVSNTYTIEINDCTQTKKSPGDTRELVTKSVIVLNNNEDLQRNPLNSKKQKSAVSKKRISRRKNKMFRDPKLVDKFPIVRIERCCKKLMKPCYINIDRSTRVEKIQKDTISQLRSNRHFIRDNKDDVSNDLNYYKKRIDPQIIDNARRFLNEISHVKPILIVNRYNFSIIEFETEFSKANIIFAVDKNEQLPDEILTCTEFHIAVMKGYLKLVDSDILCDYLKGTLGPGSFI